MLVALLLPRKSVEHCIRWQHNDVDHRRHRPASLGAARLSVRPHSWQPRKAHEPVPMDRRRLGRLAESWRQDPPSPGTNAFGDGIADYQRNIILLHAHAAQ